MTLTSSALIDLLPSDVRQNSTACCRRSVWVCLRLGPLQAGDTPWGTDGRTEWQLEASLMTLSFPCHRFQSDSEYNCIILTLFFQIYHSLHTHTHTHRFGRVSCCDFWLAGGLGAGTLSSAGAAELGRQPWQSSLLAHSLLSVCLSVPRRYASAGPHARANPSPGTHLCSCSLQLWRCEGRFSLTGPIDRQPARCGLAAVLLLNATMHSLQSEFKCMNWQCSRSGS